MADEPRVCADCRRRFVFSEQERVFFVARALAVPRRCPPCRKARRQGAAPEAPFSGEPPSGTRRRETASGPFVITCSACSEKATVPFLPEPGRSVYCGPCHHARRGAEKRAANAPLAVGGDKDILE